MSPSNAVTCVQRRAARVPPDPDNHKEVAMPHALVVDDESDSAEMMAALISTEGFTVATAGSLRDAR